ncbi:hypothetical protein HZB03_01285 [Candidatus Woesearchaeota archaeon]|nr:hypothetical protein [Candidatus Woesearchaeota archaeon]
MQEEVLRSSSEQPEYFKPEIVEEVLTQSLESFKEVIHPSLYSKLEKTIDESASKIAQDLNSRSYGLGRAEQVDCILSSISSLNYEDARAVFEKKFIYTTLAQTGFDVNRAAKYLDISEKTLHRKIKKHGIDLAAEVALQRSDAVKQPQECAEGASQMMQTVADGRPVSEVQRLRELMKQYQRRIEERQKISVVVSPDQKGAKRLSLKAA